MLRPESFLTDSQRAAIERFRLRVVTCGAVEHGEIVERIGKTGMLRAEDLLLDRQRALIERFCFFILASLTMEIGEIDETGGGSRMIFAQRLLVDGQSSPQKWLGLSVLPLRLVECRQIIEALGSVR